MSTYPNTLELLLRDDDICHALCTCAASRPGDTIPHLAPAVWNRMSRMGLADVDDRLTEVGAARKAEVVAALGGRR